MLSFNLNHFPKVSASNKITLGDRVSTYEVGGGTNFQSMTFLPISVSDTVLVPMLSPQAQELCLAPLFSFLPPTHQFDF